MSFNQRLDQAEQEKEIVLPDDIMPSFEKLVVMGKAYTVKDQRATKKQKTWGPIQPTRQSQRIDRTKNIMEKAKEKKMRSNLEIPDKFKGIIRSNPFSILQCSELESMAKTIGVDIVEH